MPRRKKGPRLWFREARTDKQTGKLIADGQWLILDGPKQISTGFAFGAAGAAEQQLASYITAKWQPSRRVRHIEDIDVAEVLAVYDADVGPSQVNRAKYIERMKRLTKWWGARKLADVNGSSCREYVEFRGKRGGARRDLEDLAAAITYHQKQGYHREIVKVVLPDKGPPRDRWLTRSEAARLIWACWRYREMQKRARGPHKGQTLPTKKRPLQHVARFILLALYTGSRAGAVAKASPYPKEGRSWVDLEAGIFYRLAEGAKATNKRQPPVRLPVHLLAHLRRWKERAIAKSHFIEFNDEPVTDVGTGFAHGVELAKLEGRVLPHTLRHTAATWLMQNGTEPADAAEFLGMSLEILQRTYWHHHPDYQKRAALGFRPRRAANETPKKRLNGSGTDVNEQALEKTPSA